MSNEYNVRLLTTSLENLINVLNVSSLQDSNDNIFKTTENDRNTDISPFAAALSLSPSEKSDVPDELKKFVDQLKNINFPGDTIQYSDVTRFVFKSGTGSFEGKLVIIDKIKEMVEDNYNYTLKTDSDFARYFYKLVDHLQLAEYQVEEMRNRARSEFSQTEIALEKNRIALKGIDDKIGELNQQTDNLIDKVYSNFITVLGIFTAIVFSIFGGIKLLEFSISSLEAVATWKAILFFSIFAVAVLSMLFVLMRWISIIVDNMARRKRSYNFVSILSSHFGFTVAMVFFMYLMFISVLFSNPSVYKNFQIWTANFSNYLIVGFILLLPFLIFTLFLIVYISRNKTKNIPRP